jgi:hypothetical protein
MGTRKQKLYAMTYKQIVRQADRAAIVACHLHPGIGYSILKFTQGNTGQIHSRNEPVDYRR